MKNNFRRKILIVVAIILVVGIYSSRKQPSLLLENVEALAYGESDYVRCLGIGSLDCPVYNVKVYSYETASR
jgi:hypothetical protein